MEIERDEINVPKSPSQDQVENLILKEEIQLLQNNYEDLLQVLYVRYPPLSFLLFLNLKICTIKCCFIVYISYVFL